MTVCLHCTTWLPRARF